LLKCPAYDVARFSNWEKLTVGDEIYIRGDRVPGTGAIRARVIVSGGFRSFVGSIESMDPLTRIFHKGVGKGRSLWHNGFA